MDILITLSNLLNFFHSAPNFHPQWMYPVVVSIHRKRRWQDLSTTDLLTSYQFSHDLWKEWTIESWLVSRQATASTTMINMIFLKRIHAKPVRLISPIGDEGYQWQRICSDNIPRYDPSLWPRLALGTATTNWELWYLGSHVFCFFRD